MNNHSRAATAPAAGRRRDNGGLVFTNRWGEPLYLEVVVVVTGGVEPPTFRFSGLRITVQDRPQRSLWLLSGLRYTSIDASARGCMRLGMRLRTWAVDC
jgi:hypothetical protein